MKLNIFASIILLSVACSATPITVCPPDLTQDGIRVSSTCSGLGAIVYADPGSTWELAWNDNPGANDAPGNDFDFNDIVADITVNDTGTSAVVTWIAGLTSNQTDALYDMGQLLFADDSHSMPVTISTVPGAEIPFDFYTPNGTFYTGVGPCGIEGCLIHDWAMEIVTPVSTPELGSMAMLGIGLLLIGARRRHLRRTL